MSATMQVSIDFQAICKRLDSDISESAGEKMAFTLIVYTPGRASYASNAAREKIIPELRRLLEHFEQGMPDVPAHKIN